MKTPQVKLSAIAPFLREGDRFRLNGEELVFLRHCRDGWLDAMGPRLEYRLSGVHLIDPISPRLEPVPKGAMVPAGTVLSLHHDTGEIWRFEATKHGVKSAYEGNNRYRLTRDEPAQLPRQVRRDELVVGDVWRLGPGCAHWEVLGVEETRIRIRRSTSGGWPDGHDPRDERLVTLLRRATVGVDAAAPEPKDTQAQRFAALRETWRFYADRLPWTAMSAVLALRDHVADPAVLRDHADYTFNEALAALSRGEKVAASNYDMIVTLENDEPQLYSEALNSAAYRAKVEEIWPSEKPPVEPESGHVCCNCGAPENKYRTLTVSGPGERWCFECYGTSGQEPERYVPPARKLPPGVAYHLADDTDTFGIPGWN